MAATTEQIFRSATLREALAQVRASLGPDAMIIDQQRSADGVIVRAALEVPADSPQVEIPRAAMAGAPRAATEVPDHAAVAVDSTAYANLGYAPQLVAQIGSSHTLDGFRQAVLSRLNYAHRKPEQLQGCYRFVGAAGVGKTSALIKVLARWVAHHGPRSALVLSTDVQRLAATEPLHLAAQMLSVDIEECTDAQLEASIRARPDRRLILIDTGGISARRSLHPIKQVKDIWVCSALHARANLLAQRAQFQALNLTGMVLTQVDQLANGDELANLLYDWRDPLLWLGTGPQLPDALVSADERQMGEALFGMTPEIEVQISL